MVLTGPCASLTTRLLHMLILHLHPPPHLLSSDQVHPRPYISSAGALPSSPPGWLRHLLGVSLSSPSRCGRNGLPTHLTPTSLGGLWGQGWCPLVHQDSEHLAQGLLNKYLWSAVGRRDLLPLGPAMTTPVCGTPLFQNSSSDSSRNSKSNLY